MARKLEDIFNECYERIRAGESLQSCLARYPEYYSDLKPMLETAFDIGRRASYIHPRPEFKHWAQLRLQGTQQYHANQQSQVEPPSRFFLRRQVWAVAVASVLILMLATGSTMAASFNALPGETLYPVKLATEEMSLAFAVTDTQKAQVQTQLVETRAKEVELLADRGEREEAALATERLIAQLEQASSAIAKAESATSTAPPTIPTVSPEDFPPPYQHVPEEQTTGTEEQTTGTEEQTTGTEEQTTGTEEQTTGTEEQTTGTEEQTTGTEEQTTTTEEPEETTKDTKYDKWLDQRERLENRLEESKARARAALKDVHEKALDQDKAYYQRLIDRIRDKSNNKDDTNDQRNWYNNNNNPQNDNTAGQEETSDNNSSQSDNTTGQEETSDNTSPDQSQPSRWDWRRHR